VSLGGPARSGDRRLLPIIVVILLVVNGGLIAGVLLSPSASAPDTAAVYAEAAPSVATIYVMEPGGERQGSGWVYDEEHLVTNQHVVGSDPTRIFVRFQDDGWSEATLVGADVYTDLAVVTVEEMPAAAAPLPLAAAPPAIGEHSVAIGSPEGTKQTVTAGVISGLHRSNAAPTQFLVTDMIQTEASLNNGDSGGPLLDAEGRVLHPYLGVETVPMTAPLAIANDRPYHAGVGVVQTIPDTPAAAVLLGGGGGSVTSDGITRPAIGDIIVGVAGRPVRDNERLGTLLRRHGQPGEPVTLTIIRDGTEVRPPPG
jgi:S1-C subfamily serine protease